jgi:hypothetical protein
MFGHALMAVRVLVSTTAADDWLEALGGALVLQ